MKTGIGLSVWRRVGLGLWGLALGACAQNPGADLFVPREAGLAEAAVGIPLTEGRGAFVVPVWVNGKGPFRFKLDTGAAAVVVSEEVARAAGLVPLTHLHVVDTLADETSVASGHQVARVTTLAVGSERQATFGDFHVRIDKGGHFPGGPEGYQGLLGFPVLQKMYVTVDFPARAMTFDRGGHLAGGTAGILPLRLEGRVPAVQVRIAPGTAGERAVELTADTGCTLPLILPPWTRELFDEGQVLGEMETHTLYGSPLLTVERHHTPIAFPGMTLTSNVVVFYGHGPVVAMGLPLLRHYRMTFDGAAGLMRFELTDPPPAEMQAKEGRGEP